MKITSLQNDKVKNWQQLNQKKYRDQNNMFLIEGKNLVNEAIKNNLLLELIVEENLIYDFNFENTYFVSKEIIKKISSLDHPEGIIGVVTKVPPKKIGDKVLLLDEIQDPGNLGTIIRSAVAFNIDTIILGDGTVDLYNSKVVRATQGMIFSTNIISMNLALAIADLKKESYSILGTKVTGGKRLKDIAISEKCAILVGNEGKGVKEELLALCDDNIYIKVNEKCESLNVAIATSIILHSLLGEK